MLFEYKISISDNGIPSQIDVVGDNITMNTNTLDGMVIVWNDGDKVAMVNSASFVSCLAERVDAE